MKQMPMNPIFSKRSGDPTTHVFSTSKEGTILAMCFGVRLVLEMSAGRRSGMICVGFSKGRLGEIDSPFGDWTRDVYSSVGSNWLMPLTE